MLLEQVRQLQRIHAADPGAPAVGLVVARANAVDDADGLGRPAIAERDLAAGGTGGVDQAFHFESSIDIRKDAVPVIGRALRVKGLEPRRDDDSADINLLNPVLLRVVNGLDLAIILADLAAAGHEVNA